MPVPNSCKECDVVDSCMWQLDCQSCQERFASIDGRDDFIVDLKSKVVRFLPMNRIKYGQDHSYFIGVPHDVAFTVNTFLMDRFVLTGYGYGIIGSEDGKGYGNGGIFMHGLTKEQNEELEKICIGKRSNSPF